MSPCNEAGMSRRSSASNNWIASQYRARASSQRPASPIHFPARWRAHMPRDRFSRASSEAARLIMSTAASTSPSALQPRASRYRISTPSSMRGYVAMSQGRSPSTASNLLVPPAHDERDLAPRRMLDFEEVQIVGKGTGVRDRIRRAGSIRGGCPLR